MSMSVSKSDDILDSKMFFGEILALKIEEFWVKDHFLKWARRWNI